MRTEYHFDVAKLLSNLEGNLLVQANATCQRLESKWLEQITEEAEDQGKKPEDHPMWRAWRHVITTKSFIMAGNTEKAITEAQALYKEVTS